MEKTLLWQLFSHSQGRHLIVAIFAAVILIPILNLLVPESSFLHVPTYTVTVLGKYLCYALLALALDLVWGYCGILSLGHGAFFALGGYAMGMYLMRQIGDRGVYGNPDLPDFMVFLNWQELPWYWYGFDNGLFAMLMVVLVPGLLAFVFGWLAFRSRVAGVYLSIITQALTYVLMQAFLLNDFGFGGNNGFTDFKDLFGFDLRSDTTRVVLFMASGLSLILAWFVFSYVTQSKMGKVLVSIRDAESRARFLGYRVEHYKLFIFILSAATAGIAGALFVPQAGIINPTQFEPVFSIEVVIWVALGGRGKLYGAIVGALVVNYTKSFYTGAMPEVWLFVLGAIFVISTLYQNRGVIVGVILSMPAVLIFKPLATVIAGMAFLPAFIQKIPPEFLVLLFIYATLHLSAKYFETVFTLTKQYLMRFSAMQFVSRTKIGGLIFEGVK